MLVGVSGARTMVSAAQAAREKGYTGDPCPECGHLTLVRNGACMKCQTCGATTGPKVELDLRFLFSRQLSLLGSYMGTMSELNEVLGHVFAGRLKPVIDHIFPLQEIRTAHEYMEKSQMFGKIVLTP